MDRQTFETGIIQLFRHFQAKKPVHETMGIWYEKLCNMRPKIFMWSINRITEEHDTIPKNVTKAINVISCGYYAAHPEQEFSDTMYDPMDDGNYPVQKLWYAYGILCRNKNTAEYDNEQFHRYCEHNRMPEGRKEAVINRYRLNSGESYESVFGSYLAERIKILKDICTAA
ncbi:MAG: hypothetical protein OCU18_03785 [Candidatus Syntrophoarchaeum sp.]|nr:hypothetical protein [Candidatus Syntrophoarchaeum sp.]